MPKLTSDGNKVTIIRLTNDDASMFYYVNSIKMALMMFDARFTMFDDDVDKIATGEYFIIDGKGFSFRHFLQVAQNVSTVRFYMKYIQEAVPFRIKNFHIVNCSPLFDKMFSLIRPFLNKEVLQVIHFHPNGLGNLHEFVPKNVLPIEYGGDSGVINDIHKQVLTVLKSKRFCNVEFV